MKSERDKITTKRRQVLVCCDDYSHLRMQTHCCELKRKSFTNKKIHTDIHPNI